MVFTTWILFSSLFCFVAYMGVMALEKGKSFMRKEKVKDQIEDRYDVLRVARREMLHYYWAQSLNEREKEAAMLKEIFKTEDQLDELRNEFESVSAGRKIPLKKI